MSLPFGWSEQYAIEQILRVNEDLMKRVAHLEQQVVTLQQGKQDRRGRKPSAVKPTALG